MNDIAKDPTNQELSHFVECIRSAIGALTKALEPVVELFRKLFGKTSGFTPEVKDFMRKWISGRWKGQRKSAKAFRRLRRMIHAAA